MPGLRTTLVSLACLGLAAVQLTGLHMHVDVHGYAGAPVGTHVHRTDGFPAHDRDSPGHAADEGHGSRGGDPDHEGDQDVSVVQLAGGVGKIAFLFVWAVLGLVVFRDVVRRAPFPALSFVPRRYPVRWRPPLRGPPALSP